jgi:hypothetical protein
MINLPAERIQPKKTISTRSSRIKRSAAINPLFIVCSITSHRRVSASTPSPVRKSIEKSSPKDDTRALNADARALKNILRAKKNTAINAAQKITNATTVLPPYSMFAEDIRSAALFISASLI